MRGAMVAPGPSRTGLNVRQCTPLYRASICSSSRQPKPHRSRALNPIKPMAVFSRYDPFGIWPPYRTSSSGWGGSSGSSSSSSKMSGEQRLTAATPAQRQAMLSNAISGVTDWQQLYSIVERYGRYLSANNVTHALTRLEQVVQGRQFLPAEAAQVQDLLEWLLQRGQELNATAQLGPQGLGATAGALSRLQQAQRQQQQQAAQQQALRQQQQEAEAAARKLRQQQAAAVERDQLMRELVDAAVSQKHRLSPQALNNLLSALAEIEESDMSADEIRQLLHVPSKSKPAAKAGTASDTTQAQVSQQQSQQLGRQQQQQQQQRQGQSQQRQQQGQSRASSSSSSPGSSRPMSPDSLQATARQLGQLSPDLAQEWYDRALRQGLEQGYLPRGIDQSYISGFLARELTHAAARAADTSSSSSRASGAVLLSRVVSKYSQLMGVDHLALAVHKLAELQEEGVAGSSEEVKAAAGSFFQLLQPLVSKAEAATLSSIINSSKDLQLYSKTLLEACLARAQQLLEQQLQGFGDEEAGFSGRRLGVLLHGLAALGSRPSDDFLRLAVTVAGTLLPSCSLTDLERLASTLIIMRINPGPKWTTAAEDRLKQLAAALGSSDSRRLHNAGQDESSTSDEDEEGTGNARRAIVSCVKALALLGGKRAAAWHRSILAAEEDEQPQQQQAQPGQQQSEEDQKQRRLREYQQQQAALAAAQQQAGAQGASQHVEQQLKKAVQQQQKGAKMHLHPHHHLQHQKSPKQQQQQQQDAAAGKGKAVPLASLDDYMDQELQQQRQQPQQQQQQKQKPSKLPKPHTSLSVPDQGVPTDTGKSAGTSSSSSSSGAAGADAGTIEAAEPAAWAAEQSSRWAQTRGEAAQPSPTAEVQQRLDDSQKLFGSKAAGRKGKDSSRGASGKQQKVAASQRQQQQGGSSSDGGKGPGQQAKALTGGADSQSKDIPVTFDGADKSQPASKASTSKGTPPSSSSSSSSGDSKQAKPSQEAQRSAAEAADALAALMAEIEDVDVAEADHEEVLEELGLTDQDSSLAEARIQAAELQEAADLVQQATEQLDNLQKQQQQKGQQAAAASAAGQEAGSSKGKHKQKQHKHDKQQPKQQQKQQQQAEPSAAKDSSSRILRKESQRPLGSSGDAAFVAAAKALQGPKKPSRTLLLGCLEAIEQQQQELRAQLAKKALQQAVAGAAQRQEAAQDPVARKLQQLQADFARARERADQEKSGIRSAASADVLEKLLPLLDSFEAAEAALDKQQQQLGAAGSEREYEEARRVYNALHAQLISIIKSHGAQIIGADGSLEGKPFDPAEMEAVMRQPAPAGFTDGDVLSVLRKGYAVGDKLVRPALVVVAYED